jgi:hypothetical protein
MLRPVPVTCKCIIMHITALVFCFQLHPAHPIGMGEHDIYRKAVAN